MQCAAQKGYKLQDFSHSTKHDTINQCRRVAGPLSTRLIKAQYQASISFQRLVSVLIPKSQVKS